MDHHAPLISTIAVALGVAFVLGMLARSLRLPPIAGYLVAGMLVGPFTPGFVGDQDLAAQLAEIGVILLMFGVGLHFSYRDLMSVKNVAVPGALVQMITATGLGIGLGLLLGWGIVQSAVFGLALSVASTVVLLRALEDRQLLDATPGKIAVGWLIVEDLAIILALVMLPVLADGLGSGQFDWGTVGSELGWTVLKVAGLAAVMAIFGRRVIPWMLGKVAATGSNELFTLGVLAVGIGVAFGAAALFDVSFALGAFFAGMVLAESDLSQRAAAQSLPFRDAFAVLFFVAVGMLVDPMVLIDRAPAVAATLAVIVVGKGLVAFVLVRAYRYSRSTSVIIAASLAQVGELSFILLTLAGDLALISDDARELLLAGALLSIVVNPALFALAHAATERANRPRDNADATTTDEPSGELDNPVVYEGSDHAVVVGYGRVGRRVATTLNEGRHDVVVVDSDDRRVRTLREAGSFAILGNAARSEVLEAAGTARATHLLVAVPDAIHAGEIVALAAAEFPDVRIIARVHRASDATYLRERGAHDTVMGEQLVAETMVADVEAARP